MARSYRRTRMVPICGDGDAPARRLGNRVYRRVVKNALQRYRPDAEVLPALRECNNKYDWPSDDSMTYLHADADFRLVRLLRK